MSEVTVEYNLCPGCGRRLPLDPEWGLCPRCEFERATRERMADALAERASLAEEHG